MFSRSTFRLVRVPAITQRLYSTATAIPTPPLLLKIRADLKDAMRNKDTNKLNVLRSLLAEIMNTSKSQTPTPLTTDIHILALINKTKSRSADSIAEFKAAGRDDLAQKEASQIAILESYASQVERVGEEEISEVINRVMGGGAKSIGAVMQAVMKDLEGKPFAKQDVVTLVKKAVGE